MSAADHLGAYAEGWIKGDAEAILKAVSDDYIFDDPNTGMNGQYFRILGRIPRAELRGCSDTFQQAPV